MEGFYLDDSQLYQIIDKLEEIRSTIKEKRKDDVVEIREEEKEKDVVERIRIAFYHQLESRTGWGRNQIKDIFEASIKSAL